LEVEFRTRDEDPMFALHGMHGRYIEETATLRLQPLKSLGRRTIFHEVGHHVYKRVMTEEQRAQWVAIASDEASSRVPSRLPRSLRAEEYFAELYASLYTSSTLVSTKFSSPEVKSFMIQFKE